MTFRLRAANAAEVALNGDWPDGRGIKLTKDDQGVWSATVGPLTPELWYYTFNVDGAVLDPANANLLRDGTRYMNFFIVPGPESENYAIRDVPHGNVNIVWYDSPSSKIAAPDVRLYAGGLRHGQAEISRAVPSPWRGRR